LVGGGFGKGDFGIEQLPKEITISSSLVLELIYLTLPPLNKLSPKVSGGGD